MGRAAELPRLLGAEVKPAVLEKLTDVAEAPQIAGLGQNEEREDGPNSGHGLQPSEIRMGGESHGDVVFQGLPPSTQLQIVLQHAAKHVHRERIGGHG